MVLPVRRAILSLIAGAVLLSGTAFASSPVAAQMASEQPSRERARMNARVFDTVWTTVRRLYYDPALHGVDWNAARETYRPRALAAADDRALYRSLSAMLDLLDDDHAGAISPAVARRQDQLRVRRAVMGVALARQDGDTWRIESVRPGSPAAEAGLEPGWLLQTVDGQSWGVDFDVEEGRPIQLDLIDEAGETRRGSWTRFRPSPPTPRGRASSSCGWRASSPASAAGSGNS